ncbi:MAG: hypothetical protein AB1345_00710 [Chloroflexota bacterium]
MKDKKVKPRDWETLSAYLDGHLKPWQRRNIEARLERDTTLRERLEEMRRTRAELRSLPVVRAPRNFTLTPQMVGMRPYSRAYPVLRLASALASVLFVLFVAGDFVWSQTLSRMPSLAEAPTIVPVEKMVEVQMAPEITLEEMEVEVLVTEEVAPMAEGEWEKMEELTETVPSRPMDIEGFTAPGVGAGEGEGVTVFPSPSPTLTPVQLEEVISPTLAAVTPMPTQVVEVEALPKEPIQPFSVLRLIEGMLALIAVGTGLAAVYMRFR